MSKAPRTAPRRLPARPSGTAPDPIQRAWTLYASGKWAEAEPLCRSILDRQTDHPGALALLGVMMAQTRRTPEAADLLGRAAARMPDNPEAHNNHGNALRDLGKHLSALSCYDRALALKPDYADAHYNRGVALYDLCQYGQALESYERTLALRPDYAAAWNNRGTALRRLERVEEALESYGRAIAARPDHADAHNNRGAALDRLDRHEEALQSFDRALALSPAHAEAHNNRGATLERLERYEEALASYDRALALKHDYVEAWSNRGVTLRALERFDEALESFGRALALAPNNPTACNNRGVTLRSLRRFDEALASYNRALEINPRFADAHFNRGVILHDLKRLQDALESYDRALILGRRDADTYRNRGAAMDALGYTEEAAASYDQALALDPQAKYLRGVDRHARMRCCNWSGFEDDIGRLVAGIEHGEAIATPFAVLSLLDEPAVQRRAAEIFVREECSPRVAVPSLPRYPRHEKIRIGYFSADFCNHAVAMLTSELFETHDRSRFELTAFSLGADVRDELRTRVEAAFDRFLTVGGQSDRAIAARARQLEIDIAIDLGGYTHSARPRIMALRPAPIQVSYIGYLGTMGGGFMDYLIADPVLIPPESRQYYTEKIAYLPSYQANDSKRPIPERTFTRAELGLPEAGFVFCCFNDSYKITPEIFSSWMRILSAAPGSVLFLLGGKAAAERNLRKEAAARGIASERLVFGGRLQFGEYLARYRAADLFLDTLPYNAGTTASDALWMGLPVLTAPGKALAARMAASLLTAVGLPELIAADRADYERLAVQLASEPDTLADLKQRLADHRSQSLLFDTRAFTANIEALYERMYERHHAELPPEHLELS